MHRLISRKVLLVLITLWPLLGAVVLLARWGADAETLRTLALAVAAVVTVVGGAAVTTQGLADIRTAAGAVRLGSPREPAPPAGGSTT